MKRMQERFPGTEGYYFLHNWSNVASYGPKMKEHMVAWARSYSRTQFRLCRLAMSPKAPPLFKMIISTGVTVLVVAGYDIKIVPEMKGSLEELGVRVHSRDP